MRGYLQIGSKDETIRLTDEILIDIGKKPRESTNKMRKNAIVEKQTWTQEEWLSELARMDRVRKWPYKRIAVSFRRLLRMIYDLLPDGLKEIKTKTNATDI